MAKFQWDHTQRAHQIEVGWVKNCAFLSKVNHWCYMYVMCTGQRNDLELIPTVKISPIRD